MKSKSDSRFAIGGGIVAANIALALLGSGVADAQTAPSQTTMQNMPGHGVPGAVEAASAQGTMPAMPGMQMAGGAGHGAGHDMTPVDVSSAPVMPASARGNQSLIPRVVEGVKGFDLTTGVVQWHILPDVTVGAYAYNGQVPGPMIRVNENDRVRIKIHNALPEPTSIHWHGLAIPYDQDGAAEVTQRPVMPGETFTYEFTIPETPGTYFYHTHFDADRQQALGLYGAFIIDDAKAKPIADAEYVVELGEWYAADGKTYSAMDFGSMLPNYFTINGKSYPATETVKAKVGERIMFRFIGAGQFIHPMHIHGGPFEIVATDGNLVPEGARLKKDTVPVGPGERYDVVWTARNPGKWRLHCHINHHITNNGAEVNGGGGLVMVVDVST
jgi:FtsP/CotA-like multicopper oxidase with cupredoxin domain